MTSPYYNSQSEEKKFWKRFREEGIDTKMNYRVKIKHGESVFMDKDKAEECAKKNKSVVEEIKALDWKEKNE